MDDGGPASSRRPPPPSSGGGSEPRQEEHPSAPSVPPQRQRQQDRQRRREDEGEEDRDVDEHGKTSGPRTSGSCLPVLPDDPPPADVAFLVTHWLRHFADGGGDAGTGGGIRGEFASVPGGRRRRASAVSATSGGGGAGAGAGNPKDDGAYGDEDGVGMNTNNDNGAAGAGAEAGDGDGDAMAIVAHHDGSSSAAHGSGDGGGGGDRGDDALSRVRRLTSELSLALSELGAYGTALRNPLGIAGTSSSSGGAGDPCFSYLPSSPSEPRQQQLELRNATYDDVACRWTSLPPGHLTNLLRAAGRATASSGEAVGDQIGRGPAGRAPVATSLLKRAAEEDEGDRTLFGGGGGGGGGSAANDKDAGGDGDEDGDDGVVAVSILQPQTLLSSSPPLPPRGDDAAKGERPPSSSSTNSNPLVDVAGGRQLRLSLPVASHPNVVLRETVEASRRCVEARATKLRREGMLRKLRRDLEKAKKKASSSNDDDDDDDDKNAAEGGTTTTTTTTSHDPVVVAAAAARAQQVAMERERVVAHLTRCVEDMDGQVSTARADLATAEGEATAWAEKWKFVGGRNYRDPASGIYRGVGGIAGRSWSYYSSAPPVAVVRSRAMMITAKSSPPASDGAIGGIRGTDPVPLCRGSNVLSNFISHRACGLLPRGTRRQLSSSPGAVSACRKSIVLSRLSHAATVNGHLFYPVYCLRFDRSGRFFVSGADDHLAKVFYLGDAVADSASVNPPYYSNSRPGALGPRSSSRGATLVCTLRGHTAVITDIDVSMDNAMIATGSEDGDCRVWGLRDGSPVAVLRGHGGGVTMVSFSLVNPCRLVTCAEDGLARVWDVRGAALKRYVNVIGGRDDYHPNRRGRRGGRGKRPPSSDPIAAAAGEATGEIASSTSAAAGSAQAATGKGGGGANDNGGDDDDPPLPPLPVRGRDGDGDGPPLPPLPPGRRLDGGTVPAAAAAADADDPPLPPLPPGRNSLSPRGGPAVAAAASSSSSAVRGGPQPLPRPAAAAAAAAAASNRGGGSGGGGSGGSPGGNDNNDNSGNNNNGGGRAGGGDADGGGGDREPPVDEGVILLAKLQHGNESPGGEPSSASQQLSPNRATTEGGGAGPAAVVGVATRSRRRKVKVICITRCPIGGHFATGSDDGIGRIWSDCYDTVAGRDGGGGASASTGEDSVDGMGVGLGGSPSRRSLRSSTTSSSLLLTTLPGHLNSITDIQYSRCGTRLLTASQRDGVVRIWSWSHEDLPHAISGLSQILIRLTAVSATTPHAAGTFGSGVVAAGAGGAAGRGGGGGGRRRRTTTTSTVTAGGGRGTNPSTADNAVTCDVALWTEDDLHLITSQSQRSSSTKSNTQNSSSQNESIVPSSQVLRVWDSRDGSCLLSIVGAHGAPCSIIAPHPTEHSLFVSAGSDGWCHLWDMSSGNRYYSHHNTLLHGAMTDPATVRGKSCAFLDGGWTTDGCCLVLTDDCGRVLVFDALKQQLSAVVASTGHETSGGNASSAVDVDDTASSPSSSTPDWMKEQYFASDYYEILLDMHGYAIDRGSNLPPHLAPRAVRCDHTGTPISDRINYILIGLVGPLPLPESVCDDARLCIGNRRRAQDRARRQRDGPISERNKRTSVTVAPVHGGIVICSNKDRASDSLAESRQQQQRGPAPRTTGQTDTGRPLSNRYNYLGYDDIVYEDDDDDNDNDDEYVLPEARSPRRRRGGSEGSDSDNSLSSSGASVAGSLDDAADGMPPGENGEADEPRAYPLRSRSGRGTRRRRVDRGRRLGGAQRSVSGGSRETRRSTVEGRGARRRRSSREEETNYEPSRVSQRQRARQRRVYREEESSGGSDMEQFLTSNRPPTSESGYNGHYFVDIQKGHFWKMPSGPSVRRKWLQRIESRSGRTGKKSYVPQVGDSVVYIPRAHYDTINSYPEAAMDTAPWKSFPNQSAWPVVLCEVKDVRYRFPIEHLYRHRGVRSIVAIVSLEVIGIPKIRSDGCFPWPMPEFFLPRSTRRTHQVFEVSMFNAGQVDFLVPEHLYLWRQKNLERAIRQKNGDPIGLELVVFYAPEEEDRRSSNQDRDDPFTPHQCEIVQMDGIDVGPDGDVVHVPLEEDAELHFQQSGYSSITVRWEDGTENAICPWEANVASAEVPSPPKKVSEDDKKQLLQMFSILEEKSSVKQWFLRPVNLSTYSDYDSLVEVPLTFTDIRMRIRRDYYSNLLSVLADVRRIKENCCKYNDEDADIVDGAKEMYRWFEELVKEMIESKGSSHEVGPHESEQRTDLNPEKSSHGESTSRSRKNASSGAENGERLASRNSSRNNRSSLENLSVADGVYSHGNGSNTRAVERAKDGGDSTARRTSSRISARQNTKNECESSGNEMESGADGSIHDDGDASIEESSHAEQPAKQQSESPLSPRRTSRQCAGGQQRKSYAEIGSSDIDSDTEVVETNDDEEETPSGDSEESSAAADSDDSPNRRRSRRPRRNLTPGKKVHLDDSDSSDERHGTRGRAASMRSGRRSTRSRNGNAGSNYASCGDSTEESSEQASSEEEEITSDSSGDYAPTRKRKRVNRTRSHSRGAKKARYSYAEPEVPDWPDIYPKSKMQKVARLLIKNLQELDEDDLFARPAVEAYPGIKREYEEKISNPMDFRTISKQLRQYQSISDVRDDIILIFRNCCDYNGPTNAYGKYALQLWKRLPDEFYRVCDELEVDF